MAENDKIDPLHDLNLDIQHYIESSNPEIDQSSVFNITSPYYTISDLLENYEEHTHFKYKAMHINIQSLPAKFDSLKGILAEFEERHISMDFIMLCETFLTDTNTQYYEIPGYNMICKNRQNRTRGGVAIYIKNKYTYKLREDLSVFKEGIFESVFLEINSKTDKCIIGEIYRVPNTNLAESIQTYETIMDKLINYKHKVIIGTDQNLDLLKLETHRYTSDLFNLLYSHSMIPAISKPTRITHNTATLIDNIYVSAKKIKSINSGIILTDLSDHFPVFTFIDHKEQNKKRKLYVKHRVLNNAALDGIKNDMQDLEWQTLSSCNTNEAYTYFTQTLQNIIDKHAPEKTINIPRKQIKREPWITKGILKSSQTVQKLFKKQLHKPKEHNAHLKYIAYRNLFNKVKRAAKQVYYSTCLEQSKGNIKQTWKTLNTLLGKTNDKGSIVDKLIINDRTVTEHKEIAQEFCSYFTNIGPQLAEQITKPNKAKNSLQANWVKSCLFLSPTDPMEIANILSNLKPKTSTGHDGLSTKLLKNLTNVIANPLTILINKSLVEGVVPDSIKIAKVLPIYKKDDPYNIQNYRPISLLPAFSKIFEKVVFKRLYMFLQTKEAIFEKQYGFRPKHSTIDAMHDFLRNIYDVYERNEDGIGIFIDFTKAFDTIDHKLLLHKLYVYGIRGNAHKWFESYLTNRKQYVNYKGTSSESQKITFGVPQGSVLGPLLFLVFINDLPNCLDFCSAILFADDSNLFHSGSNKDLLIQQINQDLNNLDIWCRSNTLSLNINKTHFIFFNQVGNDTCHLQIGNRQLSEVQSTLFLGIHIDNKLNWHKHIEHVQKKLCSQLYIINRVKHCLSKENLRTLYFTLIEPHLTYGITMWGGSHSTYLNRVFKLQKRAVRIIEKIGYRDHTEHHFKSLKILPLKDLYQYNISTVTYKYHKGILPIPLQNIFTQNLDYHNYNTRNRLKLVTPKHKSAIYHRSIMHMGPHTWNQIPEEIRNINNYNTFRKKCKEYLLKKSIP